MTSREYEVGELQCWIHTVNTKRKNGRKWSNISVKKYHHNPGLGVRSGRVMLALRRSISRSVVEPEHISQGSPCLLNPRPVPAY